MHSPLFYNQEQLDDLEEKGAIVIMSVNNSARLTRALSDRSKILRFPNPSENQRKMFFGSLLKKSEAKFSFKEDKFVDLTKGYNFRQMRRLWNECIFYYMEKKLKVFRSEDLNTIYSLKNPHQITNTMVR